MLDVRAALTSPARRASETAMRMTDRTETEGIRIDLTGGDVAKYPLAP